MSAESHSPNPKPHIRPINLNPLELAAKLPPAGIVSLLHRVSGVILFLSIPLVIFLLDISLRSAPAFSEAARFFNLAWVKALSIVLVWALMHHMLAGFRFLILDMHLGLSKSASRYSALASLALSIAITVYFGVKLW